jgi:7,8-dihydropterin-6-yl-methyl-4-(beta-D-ribofuranosyl)aminobenzene 5'-phosphate synthase
VQYLGGNYKDYHFTQSGRFWKANIEFIKDNKEIEPGNKLITTTSDNMGYFNRYPNLDDCLSCESHNARFDGLKEISLSLESDEGEILFVGCSHSTVEKIIIEAKNHTKNDIAMVYGGYHLLPYDRKPITGLAYRLKHVHKVTKVPPAHCTGHLAFKILQNNFEK